MFFAVRKRIGNGWSIGQIFSSKDMLYIFGALAVIVIGFISVVADGIQELLPYTGYLFAIALAGGVLYWIWSAFQNDLKTKQMYKLQTYEAQRDEQVQKFVKKQTAGLDLARQQQAEMRAKIKAYLGYHPTSTLESYVGGNGHTYYERKEGREY